MDIQSVKLRGMTGIKKGLGLDELALDFSQMSGMIAISGPTGSGKTTIMENLQPYSQLVSRPETALKNHVFLRDSYKDLSFFYDDSLYRTLMKLDANSGRAEGYVWKDGHPQINGKISEYSQYIKELFGTPNLFFNSVFCAQNSTKISGLRPAELKALFAEFLGPRLQILTAQEIKAKEHITFNSLLVAAIAVKIQTCAETIEQGKKYKLLKSERVSEEDGLKQALDANKKKLVRLQEEVALLRAGQAESDHAQRGAEEAYKKVAYLETESKNAEVAEFQAEAGLFKKITATRAEKTVCEQLLGDKLKIYEAKNVVVALTENIEHSDKELAEVNDELQKTGDTVYYLKIQHQEKEASTRNDLEKIEREKAIIQGRQASEKVLCDRNAEKINALSVDSKLSEIGFEIEYLQAKILDLEKRDAECVSSTCSFITGALAAQVRLPIAEEEKIDRERELAYIKKELQADANLHIAELEMLAVAFQTHVQDGLHVTRIFQKNCQAELAEIEKIEEVKRGLEIKAMDIKESRRESLARREAAQLIANRADEMAGAEVRKQILESTLRELSSIVSAKKQSFKIVQTRTQGLIDDLKLELDILTPKISAGLPEQILKKDTDIKQLAVIVKEETTESEVLRTEIAILENNVELAMAAADKKKRMEVEKANLSKSVSEWTFLKNACGANGLRALEIESVAPEITHDANSLLEKAFGSWAMVDFKTLSDEGKEVLEPRVIDQDGDSVLIGNRSGGQQVWALKALRLAMTMVSKKRSGKNFKTLFCDEDDAGLDVETAQNFTKLYRAIMGTAGFKKCFYISHKPDCVAIADSVIDLTDMGN